MWEKFLAILKWKSGYLLINITLAKIFGSILNIINLTSPFNTSTLDHLSEGRKFS